MTPARRHMDLVSQAGCVVGNRHGNCEGRVEVHHVAEGSGLRSDYSTAGLCTGHHTGAAGLHCLGVKRFCSLYRVPGETEYGLLVWVNEDIAKLRVRLAA